ncbi:phosphomannomutase [Jannaschia seohaensis]|uniref:Phosphomannomutase n=1 Tax=Jannaschia seohaensis TaxID=475081 RepID=A0A2Y9B5C7_9RHOB|nr:phosphomannomutase [Jannaschia seohaensis]PWJ12910.1 phosphomannomutase [Jannaschia seohaensis]SSA50718.1 phosphomannomutase [Jannaschia seohaensis]
MPPLTCFKAYDIRGRLGTDLDAGIAARVGAATAQALGARRVVLGRDIRASSEELAAAVAQGLMAEGAEVLDLGLCGTEEVYFGTDHLRADAGICVTASHNPMDYNGMKLVKAGSAPLTPAELQQIKETAEGIEGIGAPTGSTRDVSDTRAAYVERVLSFVDVAALRPLKVLVNAGNGAAGPTFDAIAEALLARGAPLDFVRMHHTPDGSFPNGIPNPLLPENQPPTTEAVRAHSADLGIAWDGDFDRCFLFDHEGGFVDGEYVVGLLAEAFLAREPGAGIVHDPRVVWNTQDIVARDGGRAIQSKTGHAFVKAVMRESGAVYGGEMSAHHYFRDFMACDSGMIPMVLVLDLLGRKGVSLAELVAARRAAFPSSGEINNRVDDVPAAIAAVEAALAGEAMSRDDTDGLSLAFADWRLNLRASNTEPLLRLNVEAKGRPDLVAAGVERVETLIGVR